MNYHIGDIIYKLKNNNKDVDTSAKYVIKEIIYEPDCDWHSGYDVSIKAVISKIGYVEEEEMVIHYINHFPPVDQVYVIKA